MVVKCTGTTTTAQISGSLSLSSSSLSSAQQHKLAMFSTDGITSQLQWLSNVQVPPPQHLTSNKALRKTSIIATIGPKTNSADMIQQLRAAGMNIVRMNFSHGSYEYHQSVIDNTRKVIDDNPNGRPLAIALDTKGPEIRTGDMENGNDVEIPAGHEFTVTTDPSYATKCSSTHLYIDYSNLPKMIEPGRHIYIDDGILALEVISISSDNKEVKVRSINSGSLSSRKGVNLPGTDVDLPALSDKDKSDLKFGVKNGVDMIFASFIRRGEDVKAIREVLGEEGKMIKIISKIENIQGMANFDDILKETDGVMVARGDLGIEIPSSQVFMAQKMMIAKCNLVGKPVICATQMLESMTNNPRPTRAEISDVANAVLDGADCVMLSGETAKGKYPIRAVETMAETCVLAEATICYPPLFNELRALTPRPTPTTETVAIAAVAATLEQNAGAIIVMSTSGETARLVSKYRPNVPVLTVTRNRQTARQIHLHRGCYPFFYPVKKPEGNDGWQTDIDNRIKFAFRQALDLGVLQHGASVVVIQGWRSGGNHTNTMRILSVPEKEEDALQGPGEVKAV